MRRGLAWPWVVFRQLCPRGGRDSLSPASAGEGGTGGSGEDGRGKKCDWFKGRQVSRVSGCRLQAAGDAASGCVERRGQMGCTRRHMKIGRGTGHRELGGRRGDS